MSAGSDDMDCHGFEDLLILAVLCVLKLTNEAMRESALVDER